MWVQAVTIAPLPIASSSTALHAKQCGARVPGTATAIFYAAAVTRQLLLPVHEASDAPLCFPTAGPLGRPEIAHTPSAVKEAFDAQALLSQLQLRTAGGPLARMAAALPG